MTSLLARLKPALLMPAGLDAETLWREKILDAGDNPAVQAEMERVMTARAAVQLIGGICAHAPFLTGILRRHPEWLSELLSRDPDEAHAEILANLHSPASMDVTEAELMRHLRVAREKNALLVAFADLGGVWDVNRITAALADFADA
ncbi:MAG: hypothetical protein ACRCYS_18685, partial [Beijerinckiaceae bacterium]